MDVQAARQIHDALYKKVNGYDVWDRNRWFYQDHIASLGYGEVGPEGFFEAVSKASPREGEVFYDLGSGTGKAVILASLLFGFSRSVGIELIEALGDVARKALARFDAEVRPGLPEPDQQRVIEFIDGSFLEHDFFSADVVFTHSTAFSPELWAKLVERFERLKPGARVVCTSKELTSQSFALKSSFRASMPWGTPLILVYERR